MDTEKSFVLCEYEDEDDDGDDGVSQVFQRMWMQLKRNEYRD